MTPSEGVLQAWRAGGPLSARPVLPLEGSLEECVETSPLWYLRNQK